MKLQRWTGAPMIPSANRGWLLPICLVALIAAVWALPYSPDCNAVAWGDDPAIARVDSLCILQSHYADVLYIIETALERNEQGLIPYHPDPEYLRRWNHRVNLYGPDTIAMAAAIKDAILFRRAVAEGHVPSQEEVSTRIGQDRLRRESLNDIIRLVKLARNQDLAGFRKLAEETRDPDIRTALEDRTPVELMEDMKENDLRQLELMLEEGEAYLGYSGHERYWEEILPAKLRREMAILKLEEAVLDASADGPDGPHAEVPRLGWLAYQERAFKGVNIELTRAAPSTVSVEGALAYLVEVLQEEQMDLSEEYRRRFERCQERR